MSNDDIIPMDEPSVEEVAPEDIITSFDNLYHVKVTHSSEIYPCTWNGPLNPGVSVVFQSRYGKDMGMVLGKVLPDTKIKKGDVTQIVRPAAEDDIALYERNKAKEIDAVRICKEKIRAHNLDMKLVSAHYLMDEPKILFFFTAEARVDFRELVKDLVSVFKIRIELRQIGVRDESRVLGGVAVCGRVFCCHGITDKLKPVSIKMAKEQNLSLNSMKISGPCGRLLCCLSYEYDFYLEEKKKFPPEGYRMSIKDVTYKVEDVNILARTIRVVASDGRVLDLDIKDFSHDPVTQKWIVPSLLQDGRP
jgi:cell fate regulator YaaT (PSP1 superfamily)